MLKQPRQTKFKKYQKGRINPCHETRAINLQFGIYGIQALEKTKLTSKQLEAIRRTITNYMKRKVKIWIRAFPDTPLTKKPLEVRMGRGKGNVSIWVCKVNKGKILFEVAGPNPQMLVAALKQAQNKLPIRTQIISKFEDLV